ncbi:tyrosine-type recombinase/integrase [Pilimelia terevasa]|uniref:tyrosine-type recombinase/integrase n=1 Tax=Pilimelia terevasa TaxID=53372 RepID=UPI001E46AC32|nr:tyrosine-type recombinase/integrase [Pilimelia terevasa]
MVCAAAKPLVCVGKTSTSTGSRSTSSVNASPCATTSAKDHRSPQPVPASSPSTNTPHQPYAPTNASNEPTATPIVGTATPATCSPAQTAGRPGHPGYLTQRFRLLVTRSGLPPVRLHDLRHGAATLAHTAGADLKTIQDQLGHSTITVTADIYTSVLPPTQRRSAEATAQLVLTAAAKIRSRIKQARRRHERDTKNPDASNRPPTSSGLETPGQRHERRSRKHRAAKPKKRHTRGTRCPRKHR